MYKCWTNKTFEPEPNKAVPRRTDIYSCFYCSFFGRHLATSMRIAILNWNTENWNQIALNKRRKEKEKSDEMN